MRAGMPDHTDDGGFWDGQRLFRQRMGSVRKGGAALLRSAGVVEARMDCSPEIASCGSKRVVAEVGHRRLSEAGFVRFREPSGHLAVWDAEDGTVLALLVGEVTRPSFG